MKILYILQRAACVAIVASVCSIQSALLPASAKDIPPLIPVENFSALPGFSEPELSPNGELLAFLLPHEGRTHALVRPLVNARPDQMNLIPPSENADINWIEWANDDILLVSFGFTEKDGLMTYRRSILYAYNVNTHVSVNLSKSKRDKRATSLRTAQTNSQFGDRVVDFLKHDPEHILLALDFEMDGKTEVYKVNVNSGKKKVYRAGVKGIQHWIADAAGEPRMAYGYFKETFYAYYLDEKTNKKKRLPDDSWIENDSIILLKFSNNPPMAYGKAADADGNQYIVEFNAKTGEIGDTLFESGQKPIGSVISNPETDELIGFSYQEDVWKSHITDPFYNKLFKQLHKILPGGQHSVVAANKKKKIYLIRHRTPQDAGTFYLLDMKTKGMSVIAYAYQSLDPSFMADVKRVNIAARDGLEIPSYLTLPKGRKAENLPTVIMPHGGPHARDMMYFDYWVQFLANRGYAVLQPNFRGSSGFGSAFMEAGYKQWGGLMQDDVTDATKWIIDEGIADKDKVCIMGASYGGYAALMGSVKEPDLYACAISINGVSNLPAMVREDKKFIGGRVRVKNVGLEGFDHSDVSPYHQAKAIKAPVLVLHAKDDPVVPYRHGKDIYKKLKSLKKDVAMIDFKRADHHLETAAARYETLSHIEKFLAKHIGN